MYTGPNHLTEHKLYCTGDALKWPEQILTLLMNKDVQIAKFANWTKHLQNSEVFKYQT